VKAFFKQNQTPIFFVLVIVLSWFPWYAGIAPETVTFIPSLLGLAMAFTAGGKPGGLNLLRSAGRWRVQPRYWLIAWFGPLVIFVMGLGFYLVMGGQAPSFTVFRQEFHLVPLWLLVVFLPFNGPVGEELGWRGYALPRLQQRSGPLLASLVIGTIWGLWHLPSFFNPTSVQASLGLVFLIPYVVGTISNSVIMTWLYNRTNASTLVAGIIWHAATDFWGPMFLADVSLAAGPGGTVTVNHTLYSIVLALLAFVAVTLAVSTKGQLGYSRTADPNN
jgi:membrane protease YdiL (CAAX protease family)